MKKIGLIGVLFFILAWGVNSANADSFQWSFDLIPSDGAISGAPGETIGWGYTITNNDAINCLELTGIEPSLLENATGHAEVFDFPILGPNESKTLNYTYTPPDPSDPSYSLSQGLYEITWNDSAPIGFTLNGFFTLSGLWFTGMPQYTEEGDAINQVNNNSPSDLFRTATYSATVTTAVPEPTTLVLLVTGLIGLAGLGKNRKKPVG